MIRRDDVVTTARLAAGLPRFLRHPVTVSEARAVVGRRLERRLQDFLAQLRAIYGRPATPFARLLRHAGCEYADVEPLARRDGVEAALRTLLRHGVYLTVEELKARRPVTRGSLAFTVAPEELRNPGVRVVLASRTSGAGTVVPMDLAHLRPGAGPANLAGVTDAFMTAMGACSGAERVVSLAWESAGVLSAEWQAPIVLPSGKIRPVHALPGAVARR